MENYNHKEDNKSYYQEKKIKEMNFIRRLIGIVFTPKDTLRSLAEKPRILFPMIMITFSTLLFFVSRFSIYQEYMSYSITEGFAVTKQYLSPDKVESLVRVGITSQLVLVPFISLLSWVIGAAILLGLVKILKGDGNYKQVLSLTGYAYVIILVYFALSIAASFYTNKLYIDLSLAPVIQMFVPISKGSYLYGLVRSIDIFTIWQYVLIGIGVAYISRLKRTKVYTIVIFAYIASTLFTAIGSKYA